MKEWVNEWKRVTRGDEKAKKSKNIFEDYKETKIVDYWPMINELHKRTKLPIFICRKVYEAEGDILEDLGILE